jgi:acyl transferase domain-containing protein/surfactin synthase thioesterase subunit/acyl carrier protein
MSIQRRNVDIAIIGMSGRFPGADSTEEYWRNLCEGVESVTFFSDQELLAANVAPSLIANPDYVKAAPMLRDVERFDAAFFGYSPKDAALMDPQQRLFLEVCWEAFENAGYDPADYPGMVGVLSTGGGVVTSYLLAKLHHADLPGQTASMAHINNDKDFLSTRVSFKLNLRGPSFTIQSACSSSLLAVHEACQNLRFGQCDMMLAGGSVVRIPQVAGYLAERRNLNSIDGHCRPFDSAARGTIFGSGVGAVLLKPLEQAVADRDHIFAVIRGTAVNNDGSAKSSYTAPSLGQQSQAVVDALDLAGVSADSVGYIECHSTGTIVGDPLEVEALSLAFRKGTERKQYCALGSVKANIGHPEQAAGIAGIIKTALVLHHKRIPPSINCETLNPAIDFAASPFYVNTKLRDFPLGDTPRRAGLNSLGIGGTNVFALLEEAPPVTADETQSPDLLPRLITLSAKSAEALVARVEQFLGWLNDNPNTPIGDICYTTNVSRSQFAFRFAAPAPSFAELKKQLTEWLRTMREGASALQPTRRARIAFMFSGQGAQHAGMAAQLYRTHSVFRNAMDRCHALAQPYLEQGLLEVIFATPGDDALVNRTDYTQPALFAVEYALAELLKSWGIAPDALIGHSLGEIAAACAAEVIALDDAMRLTTARGALMQRLPSGGAMVSIMAEESVVRALIDKVAPEIAVAAMNGPLNTVVSGEQEALRMLTEEMDRQRVTYRQLRISNALHSPSVEPILDDLENVADQIKHNAPKLPMISNVTGGLMSDAPDKSYWRRHARDGVRFGDGMLALAKLECQAFVEIGPHPVLLPMAQACLAAQGKSAAWIATLNRQKSDAVSVTEMLVTLFLAGHKVDWAAVHAGSSWRRIPLPTYPFKRNRHWIEDDTVHTARARDAIEQLHPLVGRRLSSTAEEVRYETRYGVQHATYFDHHRVLGTVVLPTTAELEAATVVGRIHFGTRAVSFDDAMHHQAMSFSNGEDLIVRVLVTPLKSDRASFKLVSAATEGSEVWHTHMTGTLRKSEAPPESSFSTTEVRARCGQVLAVADLYDRLARIGLEYGPAFRGVQETHFGQHEALTRVRLPDGLANAQYVLHPAFLDACLHAYPLVLEGADAEKKAKSDARSSYLPVSLERFRCYQDGIYEAWVHTKLRGIDKDDTQIIDIRVYDTLDRLVAEVEGLAVRPLQLDKLQLPVAGTGDLFYRAVWQKSVKRPALPEQRRAPGSWVILADAKGIGVVLARRLEATGHHCHLVYRDAAFAQRGPRTWTVNERQPYEFRQLLEQISASETLPSDGVVYLWGLDAPPIEGLTLAGLKSGSEMMCRGALAILHALAETRSTKSTGSRLWFVTANTQKTDGPDQHVDPVQAPLWGLGRTVAIEYPRIWGGLIDLQLNGDRAPDIDLLALELLQADGETQIAISAGGRRNVPRFIRQSLAELPTQLPRVRGDATYLVTGGLGMLGHSAAKWLISKGAKHLVLTGRNASAEAAQKIFSAAEINKAAIHLVAADISRDEDVSRLLQTISNELPPLRGVVHSAGVLDDGILAQLDWDRFSSLFEPRVYGSWLLHEYTKPLELDFFIFKSTLLSLLGSAGQGNYTASSVFLDSLAAYRRTKGLPATAINWSAWSGGGLATASGARGEAMWSSLGIKFLSPDRAMQAFDELMHRDVDQIAVAAADWPTYTSRVGEPAFLSELLNRTAVSGSSKFVQEKPAPGMRPMAVNDQARQLLLSRLQQHIMGKLGFTEIIDPNQRLNDLGVDSLMSVTLSNSLEKEFGIPVSVAEIIKGPTINQLVDGVFANLSTELVTTIDTEREPAIRLPTQSEQASSDARADASVDVPTGPFEERVGAADAAPRRAPPLGAALNGGERAKFQSFLQRRIMAELGFGDPIDPDQPLNEVGLDSLRSVALSNGLEKDFGIPVPVAVLIKGSTINQLVDYLVDQFAGTQPGESVGTHPVMAVRTPVANPTMAVTRGHSLAAPAVHVISRRESSEARIAGDRLQGGLALEQVTNRQTIGEAATNIVRNGTHDVGRNVTLAPAGGSNGVGTGDLGTPGSGSAGGVAVRAVGKWLIAPRPNPNAKARLFCFPYAGGGLVSFRSWPQLLDESVEMVAVEPPGRGTRINETAVDDLDTFVERLLPEMIEWLDRPSAFFGHCIGGLTMFATLRALPEASAHFIKYLFACGVKPPHLLKHRGEFEDNLAYEMMLHPDFDIRIPPYAQSDEIFADIIRQFDVPGADKMLALPKLRKALLPTIRAEFAMAYNYGYRPGQPFSFPIASFVGDADPWVSAEDSAAWGRFTRDKFTNHLCKGSHFLMADDPEYILQTINKEFANFVSQ